MVFRFGVARCCCGGAPPTSRALDSMWEVTWSNTVAPYDVLDQFGSTNAPRMSFRTTNETGSFASGFTFGMSPWYIFNPMDPFNNAFGGWARDNIVLTFQGGGSFGSINFTDLPADPNTATLSLWLRNYSDSTVDYTINAQSFWYPNQTYPNFDGIDPRSPVPAGKDPWSSTAVVASAADGLPTEALSAADSATVDSTKDTTTWYNVNIDVTASYRAATQWWRDTARPTEQHVQYVLSTNALKPTAADITDNLTDLFGNITGAGWSVAADAPDLQGDPFGSAGHPFPALSFT